MIFKSVFFSRLIVEVRPIKVTPSGRTQTQFQILSMLKAILSSVYFLPGSHNKKKNSYSLMLC